jgi:flagellar assembly protein FliH
MAVRLISSEAASGVLPMPWQTAAGTVPLTARTFQNSAPEKGSAPSPDLQAQTAQLQAKLAALEAEKERLIAEARAAGRREGEASGRLAAEEMVQPVLQRLAASIQQVSELPSQLRMQAEVDLVRLAVAIAQRILQRELHVDPEVITGLVRVGLEKVRMQEVTRVRVSPDHQAAVQEFLARSGAAHIEVNADPAQEPGSMIFETSRGNLDVSIGTQLREIERGLTDRLRGQG